MKTGYVVGDAMTNKPITVSKNLSIKECALLMEKNKVGSVLVLEKGKLLGIATDKDFVYKGLAKGLALSTPVEQIMSTKLFTISPSVDILDAVNMFSKHHVSHLPVMEKDNLVGYLTLRTVLKIEPQLFELLSDLVEVRNVDPDSPLYDQLGN